jgi:hypothetical protein
MSGDKGQHEYVRQIHAAESSNFEAVMQFYGPNTVYIHE